MMAAKQMITGKNWWAEQVDEAGFQGLTGPSQTCQEPSSGRRIGPTEANSRPGSTRGSLSGSLRSLRNTHETQRRNPEGEQETLEISVLATTRPLTGCERR